MRHRRRSKDKHRWKPNGRTPMWRTAGRAMITVGAAFIAEYFRNR